VVLSEPESVTNRYQKEILGPAHQEKDRRLAIRQPFILNRGYLSNPEQMIALSLLAYVVGIWFGEAVRDMVYGKLDIAQVPQALLDKPPVDANAHPKWLLYSGLFVLLKQKLRLPSKQVDAIANVAAGAFGNLIYGNVRSVI